MDITYKKCRICVSVKPINEFPSQTHAICKVCRNKKLRESRKNNKKRPVNLSDFAKLIASTALEYESGGDKDIYDLIDLVDEFKKDCIKNKEHDEKLSFIYILDQNIQKYLHICYKFDEKFNQNVVHEWAYDRQNASAFFESHNLSQDEVIKKAHEMTFMFDTMNGIRESYNYFIESYNIANSKVSGFQKVPYITVFYNINTESIECSKNPLNLDEKSFFEKVKSETQEIYCVKAFHLMGRFEQFYKRYEIV